MRQAAFHPQAGGAAWEDSKRPACLAELQAPLTGVVEDPLLACDLLLDAALRDRAGLPLPAGKSYFLHQLDMLLNEALTSSPQVAPVWNDVVSMLRQWMLPGLSTEQQLSLEFLFGQARVLVAEAEQRTLAYWEWQAERQNDQLRNTNRALLTTFDIHQLGDVLYENLPGLGIPSAYLVLSGADAGASRLMAAYTENGRAAIPGEGWPFPTRQLVPGEFLPAGRRYSLVVEPLYFQERTLGYAIFEIGPRNGDIYELVRSNLSSAIQGAHLFDEISRARLNAEKADRIKSRLLANVSHELRTPLNIILGSTQNILKQQPGEADLQKDIHAIHDHAEHQLRVINDLLDLSRAEIDELDLSPEYIDPLPLLRDAFDAMAGQSANPQVTWRLNLPARLPLVFADPVRLRQVLLNLLNNAQKFTERGQVELGAEVLPPDLHFWVSDTGSGIPIEQQERIFEPFVTMEQDRRIAGGIGLGLSITRHLVALHGGRMSIQSEPGKGSDFHIYVPLPGLIDHKVNRSNTEPVLVLIAPSGPPAPEIEAISRQQGLAITPVSSLEEIEVLLANTRPAAIAWDLSASRPGDWNMIRRLRHQPSASQCPFILYGQVRKEDLATTALEVGLTSFVVKSPGQKSLVDALNVLSPSTAAGTILIVDDDPEARRRHQALVEQNFPAMQIQLAENGEAALAYMQSETPALVLLDLVMPGLSGLDVIDRMRTTPQLRLVPVVVLSSKMLGLEEVKRLEPHAHVVMQSKGIWSQNEAASVLHRVLFGGDTLPAHTSALVKGAVAYFHQNYGRPLSRWEIAEAVGASEDYLSKIFNRELEISPWDYLNRFRILQAETLLRSTHQSIAAIARQVGFKDSAYFSRVFSKINGRSPQQYRDEKS